MLGKYQYKAKKDTRWIYVICYGYKMVALKLTVFEGDCRQIYIHWVPPLKIENLIVCLQQIIDVQFLSRILLSFARSIRIAFVTL